MKTKVVILVFASFLLFSCAPATTTQEDEVAEITTEEIITEAPSTQELITTEEPTLTDEPTETPIACVTLLTPVNGVEIPPVGKVTFSWTAIDEAGKYILNIILPSGDIVPFETDQTVYERYMEAFSAGGEYQWQVVAQDENGSQICVSEVATFNKSTYEQPQNNNGNNGGNDGDDSGNGGNDGGGEVPCEDTPAGCGGEF